MHARHRPHWSACGPLFFFFFFFLPACPCSSGSGSAAWSSSSATDPCSCVRNESRSPCSDATSCCSSASSPPCVHVCAVCARALQGCERTRACVHVLMHVRDCERDFMCDCMRDCKCDCVHATFCSSISLRRRSLSASSIVARSSSEERCCNSAVSADADSVSTPDCASWLLSAVTAACSAASCSLSSSISTCDGPARFELSLCSLAARSSLCSCLCNYSRSNIELVKIELWIFQP